MDGDGDKMCVDKDACYCCKMATNMPVDETPSTLYANSTLGASNGTPSRSSPGGWGHTATDCGKHFIWHRCRFIDMDRSRLLSGPTNLVESCSDALKR